MTLYVRFVRRCLQVVSTCPNMRSISHWIHRGKENHCVCTVVTEHTSITAVGACAHSLRRLPCGKRRLRDRHRERLYVLCVSHTVLFTGMIAQTVAITAKKCSPHHVHADVVKSAVFGCTLTGSAADKALRPVSYVFLKIEKAVDITSDRYPAIC